MQRSAQLPARMRAADVMDINPVGVSMLQMSAPFCPRQSLACTRAAQGNSQLTTRLPNWITRAPLF